MPKNILVFELQRPHPSIPWGFCIQGGKDMGLTVKIGNVKRATPASRAGLHKMDYLISINSRPVFNMTHGECVREIKSCGQQMVLECERGDHIVPSFEELFPGLRQDSDLDTCKRKKHIGDDYYQNAMENHGLGHLPQPDNFTTVGNNLGIEINQYNCPIEAYSTGTIDEMKEMKEKGGLDVAGRIPAKTPAEKFKFDPSKSNAYKVIQLDEGGRSS
eukprot:TRINITY_DN7734_c2_g1_i1.p1 TRINITY_DN7734_c2_g1~~TRINITY_DN7734_c2_g1_i1.p1  ORF type:complete len:227 (-),score=59.63 TRINITY_DN7734_c2_g1_i1:712-1362(-)